MLRVGIVGVGWGAHVQAPAFRAVPGFDLVALCSRTPERVTKAAGRLGIEETSTDWHSFIARDDLDVISVATPTGLHGEIATAALAAGKAVLCEKPLTATTAEADALIRAAAESGRPTGVCFENRWSPDWLAVGERVRAGFLGATHVARVTRAASYWHPSRPLMARWMYDRVQGGGYLAGMLAHDLDLICSLLGPPVEVCADVRTSIPVRELPDGERLQVTADDTSAVLLRMASGALAMLSITVMGAHADAYGLELYGTDGTIVGNGSLRSVQYRAGRPGDESLAPLAPSDRLPVGDAQLPGGLAGQAIRSMALMLEDWLPAFAGAPSPVPTLQDGRLVVAITQAAHRSAEGAGWVRVDRGDGAP